MRLEKWGRNCVYCGDKGIPLEVEHATPLSRGGSDRVSNLAIACRECNNNEKGNMTLHEWMEKLKKSNRPKDKIRLANIQKVIVQLKKPLKDTAIVNSSRWYIFNKANKTCLPLEMGTGGRTKYNRIKQELPKTHYLDAACVGASTPKLQNTYIKPVEIRAVGRGNRQMARVDRYGFPKGHRQRKKNYFGFQTGDMVKAVIQSGKYAGVYSGVVAIRSSGYFDIKDFKGKVLAQGISHRCFRLLQYNDGYSYG